MASLLDLTSQGDVATISDESKLATVQLMTPRQLYELWERQNWRSHEIDFTQDRRDWEAMDPRTREEISWGLANFFVGEERVATQFTGLVMAYDDQHEEAFLTTQQVDEARHAQHFNRLYEQVLAYDGSFEDRLDRCREVLNEHYVTLFDGHLVEANQRLIANPRDVEAKIDFVVTYHMVIEGTLALTGQYFQTDWMERRGILPGSPHRLPQDLPGRASPRRLRHLVPQAGRGRPRARRAHPGPAHGAAAGGRRRARAARLQPRRRVRVHGLHQPGDERVRVHRAHAAAEGHRRLAGRRARLRPHLITVISGWVASSVWVKT